MFKRFPQRSEDSKDSSKPPNDKIVVRLALEELLYRSSTLEPHSLMSLTCKMILVQQLQEQQLKKTPLSAVAQATNRMEFKGNI